MTHGTLDQYKNKRCRCDDCGLASYRYEKRRKWLINQGLNPTLPVLGFRRRVHALMALGHTQVSIAVALGIKPGNLAVKLRKNSTVTRATHVAMCDLYERWAMVTPPPTVSSLRTKSLAIRNGWLPPLAWDNVDDPNERPLMRSTGRRNDDVDDVVVLRVLSGEYSLPTTRAEKDEVMRRWRARGMSERELCARTGWKESRYGRPGVAA